MGYKLSHLGQNSKSAPWYYSWYMWKVVLSLVVLAVPAVALAAGLVPCGGAGEPVCQTCHFALLITGVFDWLVKIAGVLVVIMIMVSGLRVVSSVGNVAAKESAKKVIANVIIGYMLLLGAYLLVDTLLKAMVSQQVYGVWNSIQCVAQPELQQWSRTTASGDNRATLPPAEVDTRVSSIASSGSVQADIAAAAAAAGITDPEKVKILKGLISQESSNCANKTGPATAYGTAYGCGQLLVSTARGLDPALAGMSDEAVAAKLRDDNAYNITLSARYYNRLLNQYGGNVDLALAAYNGGPKANQSSGDCPGQRRWQCVWDSPGCYNTGQTDCARNTGYAETRNYVTNIKAVAAKL